MIKNKECCMQLQISVVKNNSGNKFFNNSANIDHCPYT